MKNDLGSKDEDLKSEEKEKVKDPSSEDEDSDNRSDLEFLLATQQNFTLLTVTIV